MNRSAPLLLISGWGTTRQVWDGVLANLPGVEAHTLGWEACVCSAGFSPSQKLDHASRNLPLSSPCLLIGWSLGALIAIQMALRFPQRIKGLVLISGTARLCADGDYPGADPRALQAMQARLPRNCDRVLREFADLCGCVAPDHSDGIRSQYLEQARQHSPEALAAGLESLATLDLRDQLEKIAVPVLLLHGARDAVVPLQSAQYLAANLPAGTRLEILKEHGHALPFSAPREVADAIRKFLS